MSTTTDARETDPFQVRALARGLSILCLFDVDHREWTIDEMAEQTGLVRMTVYRMVRTLESMAFLVRDATTNRYRLGPATLAMTYVSDDQSEFIEAARPYLESLVQTTGESVTLAVEVDGFPVCVDIVNTTRPFRRRTAPGRILGDIASVHGKIFAAFRAPEEREAILTKTHPQWTPNRSPIRGSWRRNWTRSRRRTWPSTSRGSTRASVRWAPRCAISWATVIATISVVVPSGRFGTAESALCTEAVKAAAASFSAYLGWHPAAPGQMR